MYVDDDGIIYDAALNQTNIGGNNNKVNKSRAPSKVLTLIEISSTVSSYWANRAMVSTMLIHVGDE